MTNINGTSNEDTGTECARLLKEIAELTNALIEERMKTRDSACSPLPTKLYIEGSTHLSSINNSFTDRQLR